MREGEKDLTNDIAFVKDFHCIDGATIDFFDQVDLPEGTLTQKAVHSKIFGSYVPLNHLKLTFLTFQQLKACGFNLSALITNCIFLSVSRGARLTIYHRFQLLKTFFELRFELLVTNIHSVQSLLILQ